jgi:hypothetical protein
MLFKLKKYSSLTVRDIINIFSVALDKGKASAARGNENVADPCPSGQMFKIGHDNLISQHSQFTAILPFVTVKKYSW